MDSDTRLFDMQEAADWAATVAAAAKTYDATVMTIIRAVGAAADAATSDATYAAINVAVKNAIYATAAARLVLQPFHRRSRDSKH
jgi:hypothetical protein